MSESADSTTTLKPLAQVMAIVNRTPDSFYDKGATWGMASALARCEEVVAQGASIVDIGGVKAGPGEAVDAAAEIDRVVPLIAEIAARYPEVIISVDTWRASVAEQAIAAGARLINDTWAGWDPQLIEVAGAHGVGYVCSHTGGVAPRTRPHRVHFDDVVADVIAATTSVAERGAAPGWPCELACSEPTHDSGKTTAHGLELLRSIDELVASGWPVIRALSSTGFVGESLRREVCDRVAGTLAATP